MRRSNGVGIASASGRNMNKMARDSQFYQIRLMELEQVLAASRSDGRNVGQLIKARDYCIRRIRECQYQDRVDVILNSN